MIVSIPVRRLAEAGRLLTRRGDSMTVRAVGDRTAWIETLPPQRILLNSHGITTTRIEVNEPVE